MIRILITLAALCGFMSLFCIPIAMLTNCSAVSWLGLFSLSLAMLFIFPVFIKELMDISK